MRKGEIIKTTPFEMGLIIRDPMDAILVLLEAAALFGVLYLVVKKAVKDAIRESRTDV